jgi:two-component system chemotaxis response regulator CheB
MVSAMLTTPAFVPILGAAEAVVIGGSLGAIEALGVLLPLLHATVAPIVVLVHLPPARPSLLPDLFRSRLGVPVLEAEDKQPLAGRTVWFAPADYHLLIERDRHFSLSVDPPVRYSRPSIDVLFESAADTYGKRLTAVVLTGASDDGAAGARAVRDAGGIVLVQEPEGAAADRMPRAAIERAEPQAVTTLDAIAELLNILTGDAA